jgi:hypothetical protein
MFRFPFNCFLQLLSCRILFNLFSDRKHHRLFTSINCNLNNANNTDSSVGIPFEGETSLKFINITDIIKALIRAIVIEKDSFGTNLFFDFLIVDTFVWPNERIWMFSEHFEWCHYIRFVQWVKVAVTHNQKVKSNLRIRTKVTLRE